MPVQHSPRRPAGGPQVNTRIKADAEKGKAVRARKARREKKRKKLKISKMKGLSAAQATGVAEGELPDLYAQPRVRPMRLSGTQSLRYTGPASAVLMDSSKPDDVGLLMESTVPLRARDRKGALAPVDSGRSPARAGRIAPLVGGSDYV